MSLEDRFIKAKGSNGSVTDKHYSVSYVLWLETMVIELERRLLRLVGVVEADENNVHCGFTGLPRSHCKNSKHYEKCSYKTDGCIE